MTNDNKFEVGQMLMWLDSIFEGGAWSWLLSAQRLHPNLTMPEILGSMREQLQRDPSVVQAVLDAKPRRAYL